MHNSVREDEGIVFCKLCGKSVADLNEIRSILSKTFTPGVYNKNPFIETLTRIKDFGYSNPINGYSCAKMAEECLNAYAK